MTMTILTAYGAFVVALMVIFYALESKDRIYTFLFGLSCLASALYGFLAGTWPFGIAEIIWGIVAFRKWINRIKEQN